MPQDFLDSLDPLARLKGWQEGFEKNKEDKRYGTLVARTSEKMAGFLSYGPARDELRSGWTEIYAINILKEFWSMGIGYELFASVCNILKGRGEKRTYLWVLSTNQNALNAYLRWGGFVEEYVKNITIGGRSLKEVSVLFNIS